MSCDTLKMLKLFRLQPPTTSAFEIFYRVTRPDTLICEVNLFCCSVYSLYTLCFIVIMIMMVVFVVTFAYKALQKRWTEEVHNHSYATT